MDSGDKPAGLSDRCCRCWSDCSLSRLSSYTLGRGAGETLARTLDAKLVW